MASRGFNYGQLMQRALRGLLVEVLTEVAQNGLPGEHHFFITFDTSHPGVDVSPALLQRYPSEMTIVLQDWFDDLAVAGDRFSVTLNFGDVPERLVIPFDAVRVFVDPSVEFGLRFDHHEGPDDDDPDEAPEPPETDGEDDTPESHAGGDVVRLDRFRRN
ncbi:SspB family protein [Oceanicella sp. SM1341]|uniref:SspB family protein n=1 Tax=Oceanicella sp. SM1341 TaxID=1548889 RepID=UPI003515F974